MRIRTAGGLLALTFGFFLGSLWGGYAALIVLSHSYFTPRIMTADVNGPLLRQPVLQAISREIVDQGIAPGLLEFLAEEPTHLVVVRYSDRHVLVLVSTAVPFLSNRYAIPYLPSVSVPIFRRPDIFVTAPGVSLRAFVDASDAVRPRVVIMDVVTNKILAAQSPGCWVESITYYTGTRHKAVPLQLDPTPVPSPSLTEEKPGTTA